eukprot:TRINITY_DN14160_c0_g1_i1.p1 TRINITY_DN14160_c0_g1~~TRINITY_DN14160_c0_g1_i1.p1  ORF type:complete len:252 (-),score=43.29 TRINITY_DN14160_c0_g1_i1:67-822(-)
MGYWGEVTASINWCEADYAVTSWIAEFWNSMSSFAFCALSTFGLWHALHFRQTVAIVMLHVSVWTVGAGSFLFHGTLLFHAQMWDELPMVWMAVIWIYILLDILYNARLPKYSDVFLFGWAVFWTLIHPLKAFVVVFQVHFGVILFSALVMQHVVASRVPRIKNDPQLRRLAILHWIFVWSAFAFWLADRVFCDYLTWYGNPQFHAWWHILQAFGAHIACQFCSAASSIVRGRTVKLHLYGGAMPYVVVSD